MRVALGKFASWGIQEHLGADPAAAVEAALLHYIRRLKSALPPMFLPELCGQHAVSDAQRAFELVVGPEVRDAIEREAWRRRVPVECVLVHAVLVYLADLDSASSPGT